ncbi:MAG: hypothetical protein HY763_08355 [Planctomycetes bacterium]|nr:hypothetical protein [Planctomycetota bacterium]
MLRSGLVLTLAVCGLCSLLPARALAQGCPCDGDVNNDGPINVIDIATVADCARGVSCSNCVQSCDVNCDGTVDFVDMGAVVCQFEARTNCCAEPNGACLGASPAAFDHCIYTSPAACALFSGTYTADGLECTEVPAVSEWGMVVLVFGTLTIGTLSFRRLHARPVTSGRR